MAKYEGRDQSLVFSGSSVGGIQDATLPGEREALDATDHDDAWDTFIAGRGKGTIDLTIKDDTGDAGIAALKDNFFSNTGEEAFVYTHGDGRKVSGNAFVTKFERSHPNRGVAMVSCTLQISGTQTDAAV